MPRNSRSSSRPQHEQFNFHNSKNSLLDQDDDHDDNSQKTSNTQSEGFHLISPDNATNNAAFEANFEDAFQQDNDDDDDDSDHTNHQGLFEPYHDPQTNRIIMRMRMGHLMDGTTEEAAMKLQYEDSSIIATEAVQDQSPAWAIFDNPAFDKFSLFNTKSKEEGEEVVADTPFDDQVSYTDPYNAFAWDSLPTFLQTPYSFMSQAKNNLTSPSANSNNNHHTINNSTRTSARQKMKQKMKETRINKQGFLEESTITTVPSSNSSANSDSVRVSTSQPQQEQDTFLEQPYAFSKQQQQQQQQQQPPPPQEFKKSISSASTNDLSTTTSTNNDQQQSLPPKPRRLSTERLQSPFREASVNSDHDDDEKKQDSPTNTTPRRRRLSKSRLESPFHQKETTTTTTTTTASSRSPPVDAPESPKLNSNQQQQQGAVDAPGSPPLNTATRAIISTPSEAKPSPPARLNPDRLKSPFQKEPQQQQQQQEEKDEETSNQETKPPMSPPKRLSQSRLQSPFLQKEEEKEATTTSPIPTTRSSPPSSPLHPAIASPSTSTTLVPKRPKSKEEEESQDSSKPRRKVSLSPPSTPILLHKVDENNATSKLDAILDAYRAMIENKAVTSQKELERIMTQEGHLTPLEIKCFVFALGISLPSGSGGGGGGSGGTAATTTTTTLVSPRRRIMKLSTSNANAGGAGGGAAGGIRSSSSAAASDAGTATSGNSYSSQRFKARASSKSTPFDPNISHLMANIKKENVIPSRRPKNAVRSDDDAKTSISVMTSLSCRELSIQRLRRRIATSNNRKEEKSEVDQLLQDLQDAQHRQKRLEQQLNQAGIQIAEDIPYAKAKAEVAKIAQQMQAIGTSQATHEDPKIQAKMRQDYFVLEQQMEKYMRALELTDEYLQEQERMEKAFDDDNFQPNNEALQQVWKHMPVNIRQYSVQDWLHTRTPSGKYIPKPFLLKFARTNILTLLRMQPDFIERAHPSNLESRRVTGLTLTERRALQAYLFPIATKWRNAKDALTKRKWNWYCILRQTLKDHLLTYQRHVEQHKQLEGGLCTCNRLQCPVKANHAKLDYFQEDYGYPSNLENPEYEQPCDPAKAPKPTRRPENENNDEDAPNNSKPPVKKSMPASRNSLLADLSNPKLKKKNGHKRQSLLADISSQKSKMKARPSSLMDEIAAKAAMRKATKGL